MFNDSLPLNKNDKKRNQNDGRIVAGGGLIFYLLGRDPSGKKCAQGLEYALCLRPWAILRPMAHFFSNTGLLPIK